MRTLEFDVKQQYISIRNGCDTSGLVAGSVNYLRAKFYFSNDEWNECRKAASFWVGNREHSALLDENNSCVIPKEALIGKSFRVSVSGASSDFSIKTNRVKIRQEAY